MSLKRKEFLCFKGEKPTGKSNTKVKREAEFVPNWSHAPPAKEVPTSSKKSKADWDDSALDQMMIEYSESLE